MLIKSDYRLQVEFILVVCSPFFWTCYKYGKEYSEWMCNEDQHLLPRYFSISTSCFSQILFCMLMAFNLLLATASYMSRIPAQMPGVYSNPKFYLKDWIVFCL